MVPTPLGQAAVDFWNEIPAHFPFVVLDAFVVMPNHVHGIIIIDKPGGIVETQDFASRLTQTHPENPDHYIGAGGIVTRDLAFRAFETHPEKGIGTGDLASGSIETQDFASLRFRRAYQ